MADNKEFYSLDKKILSQKFRFQKKGVNPQEAKKLVNECGLNINEPLHSKVLDVINAALQKQMPNQVVIRAYQETVCSCGYVFSKHHGDGYYSIPYERKTKFCPNCGQALDWGDKDD